MSDSTVIDQPAYSVAEFCAAHGIGRGLFYKMLKKGEGPQVVKAGRRTLILGEAAAAWRRKLLAESPTPGSYEPAAASGVVTRVSCDGDLRQPEVVIDAKL